MLKTFWYGALSYHKSNAGTKQKGVHQGLSSPIPAKGDHDVGARFFGRQITLWERFLEIFDRTNHLHAWKFVYYVCLAPADFSAYGFFAQPRAHGCCLRSSLPVLRSGGWRPG